MMDLLTESERHRALAFSLREQAQQKETELKVYVSLPSFSSSRRKEMLAYIMSLNYLADAHDLSALACDRMIAQSNFKTS